MTAVLVWSPDAAAGQTSKPAPQKPAVQPTQEKPPVDPRATTPVDPRATTPAVKPGQDEPQRPPGRSTLPAEATNQTKVSARQDIQQAQAARVSGRFQEALTVYEAALQKTADRDAHAEVSIAMAQTLESWVQEAGSTTPENEQRLSRAAALYQGALESGPQPRRQLARNNLGTVLLQQRRFAEAVTVLERLDFSLEPERQFLYDYNLGRALELAGRQKEAFTRYLASVHLNPAFAPTREAAGQMLLAERPINVANVEALATALISRGQPSGAAGLVRSALRAGDAGAAERLLRVLMRAWVGMAIELEPFARDEVPFLRSLPESAGRWTREIERAVLDPELPLVTRALEGEELFPVWTNDYAPELAALLKHSGDVYRRTERYLAAASRYGAAWAIDRGNSEAALFAAMLLQEHKELDPRGRLLNLLIEDVFQAKSAFRSRRDWPNSLRLHLVLGSIFETMGRWGPENDARTALFQWRAALDAETQIRREDKSFTPSPGLYLKLGECYLRLGRRQQARQHFSEAAKAFEQTGRLEEASVARQSALAVPR